MNVMDIIIMGMVLWGIYSLISIGFSLVFGVGGILNQAHGAFYILSGYFIFWFMEDGGFIFPIAAILGLICIIFCAIFVYLALIKPFQDNQIIVLMITFAFAFFAEQFIKLYEISSVRQSIQNQRIPSIIAGSVQIYGLTIQNQTILTLICSIIIVILVLLFIKKSTIGKSIRAVSQDKDAAQLIGINVDRILMFTFVLSSILIWIAALLYIPQEFLRPENGWPKLLSSFSIVILGGLGSLKGSIIGAGIIAFTKSIVIGTGNFAFSGLIPLIVMVVVLIIRPQGIFGKKERT